MAIRFLLGNMFEIGTLQGERIATPVCGLVRNDREIGPWFLKLMTLPRGEGAPVRTLGRMRNGDMFHICMHFVKKVHWKSLYRLN